MEQIDDGALVPVSDVKRKIHHSLLTTIATALRFVKWRHAYANYAYASCVLLL